MNYSLLKSTALLSLFILFGLSCKKKIAVNDTHGEIEWYTDVQTNSFGDTIYAVFIPGAFSPNNDFSNEVFKPLCRSIKANSYSMSISDLNGQEVYFTDNPDEGWNGCFHNDHNKILPQQSYWYKITCVDLFKNETHLYEGTVLLVR